MQYLSELKSERGNADSETLDEADTSESVGSGFYVSNIKSGIKVSHLYKYNMYKSIICIYICTVCAAQEVNWKFLFSLLQLNLLYGLSRLLSEHLYVNVSMVFNAE